MAEAVAARDRCWQVKAELEKLIYEIRDRNNEHEPVGGAKYIPALPDWTSVQQREHERVQVAAPPS